MGIRHSHVRCAAVGRRERLLHRGREHLHVAGQIVRHGAGMGDDHDCDTQVRLRFGERQNRDTGRGGEGDRVDALPDLRRGVLRALERLAGRANRATDRPGRQGVGLFQDADFPGSAPEARLPECGGGRLVEPGQTHVHAPGHFIEDLPVLAVDAEGLAEALDVVDQMSGHGAARTVGGDLEHGRDGHLLLDHQRGAQDAAALGLDSRQLVDRDLESEFADGLAYDPPHLEAGG